MKHKYTIFLTCSIPSCPSLHSAPQDIQRLLVQYGVKKKKEEYTSIAIIIS